MNRPATQLMTKPSKKANQVSYVGYQSWTDENLCVESNHEGIVYYTTRWDALCPYIDVTEEMLASAPKPFVVYAVPPEGKYGVPISDHYGLVNTASDAFWADERRARRFKEMDKQFKNFIHSETVVAGSELTCDDIFEMGGEHFENCEIDDKEIAGFVDYIRTLDVLILQVKDQNGELVFTDVSILMPKINQIYGSFCQWNRAYKNRSPGLYACLLASRWAAKNGYHYYNLGPVGDYGYKSLFVTDLEPIYALALSDLNHPLALDPTSPLNTDFNAEDLNIIYRNTHKKSNHQGKHAQSANVIVLNPA